MLKILYELEAEKRSLPVLQALTLLTHCTEWPNQVREGWYWLGIAISVAFAAGLHQENHVLEYPSNQRRRIWWTLYVRDRIQAQYLSRPMRIRDDDFDTLPLTTDHFDINVLQELDTLSFPTFLNCLDISSQCMHAAIFMKMAELCTYAGRATAIHFSMLARQRTAVFRSDITQADARIPKTKSAVSESFAMDLHSTLMKWYTDIPDT